MTKAAKIPLDDKKFVFTEKCLRYCPLCENTGSLPSPKTDLGYEDCLCKSYRELYQSVLGESLARVKPIEGKSQFHKLYGKDIFIRALQSEVRDSSTWNLFLRHVRRILQDEYYEYLQKRNRGEFCRLPRWKHVPGQLLLDLEFDDSKEGKNEYRALIREPWIVLEIGETDKRNIYMRETLLSFESMRRTSPGANFTWVFSKRSDSWLQERYGVDVVQWLNSLQKVEFKKSRK